MSNQQATCRVCKKQFNFESIENYGIPAPTLCGYECKRVIEKQEVIAHRELIAGSIVAHFPVIHAGASLHDFKEVDVYKASKLEESAAKKAYQWATSNYWCINLIGEQTGIGKTRLALALLAQLAALGKCNITDPITEISQAGFYTARDIDRDFESDKFDKNKRRFDRLATLPVLVIDDLGQEDKFSAGRMCDVIDKRQANNLKTIITTNHSTDKLTERYGRRLLSRIGAGSLIMKGSDSRINQGNKNEK